VPGQIFAAFATTEDEHFKVFRLGHFSTPRRSRASAMLNEHLDPPQQVVVQREFASVCWASDFLKFNLMVSADCEPT
jgi:hypothetical protein